MQYSYSIAVQFVDGGIFDAQAKDAVQQSVQYYNVKGLTARNPKSIKNFAYSDHDMTLTLVLTSEAALPVPSKALRLLSSYLIDEAGLSHRLYGKHLFKMAVLASEENYPALPSTAHSDAGSDLEVVASLIRLRMVKHPKWDELSALILAYAKEV